MADVRFIAEWESCGRILMALPTADTDWGYMLDRVREQYRRIVKCLTEAGENVVMLCHDADEAKLVFADLLGERLTLIPCRYNDTWTRDYGPLAAMRDERLRLLDFSFNGWGLKFAADRDNLVCEQLRDLGVWGDGVYRWERDYELEGGSVDTDGQGTILTTSRCLCSPNRNGGRRKQEINEILAARLGADHVLWLDYGYLAGDDTDSHIDTLARMAPDNTIVFTGCHDENDEHFEELLKMRAQLMMFRNAVGEGYNLVELPLPAPIYDEDGLRLPATYANYLVTERNIFIPSYGQPDTDRLAMQTLAIVFPDHKAHQIDCRDLICQHGSLHCATMQIPDL